VKVTDTRGKWRGLNLFLFSAKFLPPSHTPPPSLFFFYLTLYNSLSK
jgi:hypothetical protein